MCDSYQIVDSDPPPPKVVDSVNVVRRFNAKTGDPIPGGNPAGVYVVEDSNDLDGPRGIIRVGDRLLVGSQNITKTGESPARSFATSFLTVGPTARLCHRTRPRPEIAIYPRWHGLLEGRRVCRRYIHRR